MLDAAECDRARLARDSTYDGRFFTGVRTTRVYCWPVCPVRPAQSRNVSHDRGTRSAADSARGVGWHGRNRRQPRCTPRRRAAASRAALHAARRRESRPDRKDRARAARKAAARHHRSTNLCRCAGGRFWQPAPLQQGFQSGLRPAANGNPPQATDRQRVEFDSATTLKQGIPQESQPPGRSVTSSHRSGLLFGAVRVPRSAYGPSVLASYSLRCSASP